MNPELRRLLVAHFGLAHDAGNAEAQTFYDALPPGKKGRIGAMLAQLDSQGRPADEQLTLREDPLQTRELTTRTFSVRAESLDEKTRSVQAVLATDDPVAVYDYRTGEVIDEVLRMDGAEIPVQVPMLDNHYRWSLDFVYGSVRGMVAGDHELTGGLHFASGDDAAERAYQKVSQGHLKDVSAGYRVTEFTDVEPGRSAIVGGKRYTAGQRTLRISTRWQLKEVSLVPIGADARSKIRQENQLPHHSTSENVMPEKLRAYLESKGLRTDADAAAAWAFYRTLQGAERTEADKLRGDVVPPEPAAAEGAGQRSDPPANPPQTPAGQRNEPPAGNQPLDRDAIRQIVSDVLAESSRQEDDRVRQIRELAGEDVPADVVDRAIAGRMTVDQAGRTFLEAVRGGRQPGQAPYHASAQSQPIRDASARSLACGMMLSTGLSDPTEYSMHNGRHDPRPADRITADDAGRGDQFARLGFLDIARQAVMIDTGRLLWDPDDVMEAAATVARSSPSGGTLSYVFTTNAYARLLAGWGTTPDTTLGWCDEEDVPNFLQQEDISLAANAALDRHSRGGTANHADVSDSHETYKIGRYSKQFVWDEMDQIDDRLGALMRMPQEMGEAARNLRPDLVYSLMLQNPTMGDTGAVFNATAVTTAGGHANLGTGALAGPTLKSAISAMVKQRINRTTKNPGRQLVIRPRFLIVPADLEWTARELTASAALAKLFADSSDPWYATLNLIAQEGIRVIPDDRVGAIGVYDPGAKVARTGLDTNWFLAAGGSRGLRVAYLRGRNRQPRMRSFVLDKGQWGLGFDINHDIGVAFTEWRTWYKSTGAGA